MKKFACLALVATTLFGTAQAVADITMGIFPRRAVSATHQAFKPLADYLSAQLGEPVKLVVPKDFATFWQGVESGQFDLVHYNQYHYLLSHKNFGYRVIAANEEEGQRTIAGALSVRTDSGINSVEELKGRKILFGGGKKAMGSYIAPTAILKEHGLSEGSDYTADFAKNPPSAAIAVYNKAADAAGTGDIILQLGVVQKNIDVSQMRILATGKPYVQLPWAVSSKMDEAKAQKIQAAMTGLKADDPVTQAAIVSGFFAVTDSDFDQVREITRFALGEDL